MSNQMAVTGDAPDATDVVKLFQAVLGSDPNGKGPLYIAWQFLQVYSVWGLRLPTTEDELKNVLGTQAPGSFLFFNPMLQAYREIGDASTHFLTNVFPKVVALGNALRSFAKDATGKDGTFSAVNDLLDQDDSSDALTLLQDIQQQAQANSAAAGGVATQLSAYKVRLDKASGDLAAVQASVEADAKTSQSTIDTLSSQNPDAVGSIANLQHVLDAKRDDYNHDVIVSTTTLTYAWVVPWGFFAAVAVAGVYGKKAVDALDEVDKADQELKQSFRELSTAIATHKVQQTADIGVTNAKINTELAIAHTTTVQNAWNQLDSDIDTILSKVDFTTNNNGLKSKTIIRIYMNQAMNAWNDLLVPLKVLTTDPFITVQPDNLSPGDLARQVESHLLAGNMAAGA